MDDLIASIDEAYNYKERDNKKFISVADHIRSLVTPKKSYPGLLSELNPKIIDQVIDILSYFRSLVLDNLKVFQNKHIVRAIDSMNIIALANAVNFQFIGNNTRNSRCLDNAKAEFREAINTCKQTGLTEEIQYSVSAIYNVASYLMKLKAYEYSIELFRMVTNLSNKDDLIAKANKLICQCLIALNETNNPDFLELVCKSSDPINILYTLIQINPPSNPDTISKMLSIISKNCRIPNFKNEIKLLLPFYALHGDVEFLRDYDDYRNFFPELQPPRICLFNQEKLDNYFSNCYEAFEKSMFNKCSIQSVSLLENFPKSKITPHMMIALFFVYYWIIYSYDAIGKPDAGIFYSKEMSKHFRQYPFVLGFAVFLELKCKIHAQDLKKIHKFPPMQFDSIYDWESVPILHRAICEYLTFDANCIDSFDEIFCKGENNYIIQREAFNYFVRALKSFQCDFDLREFQDICSTSKETKAMFLYHMVTDNIKKFDFNELWSYSNNKRINKEAISKNLSILDEAEEHAKGFMSITRKIKQLKALLIGTSNMEKTAILLSSSLSLYLDKQLPSCPNEYQLKYPILASVYLHIDDIPPCLLFAYFCPRTKPFVVRIETGDHVDNFLDKLEEIHQDSMNLSSNMARKEWWKGKLDLDKKLEQLIKSFEVNVLGFWKCLLAPISPSPQQSALASILSIYLQSIPQKSVDKVRTHIERTTGFTFPNKIGTQNEGEKMTLQLLLGKFVHQIPWESMPFVRGNNISITRIPSMKVAAIQSFKQVPVHIDSRSGFFVLNPNGDLENTEREMFPLFKKMDWNGFVKKKPDRNVMLDRLQNTDLFVYCGHGSGTEFFNYDSLIKERKSCKSTMLLMGCSSGKLSDQGDMEPIGVPYYCVAAGAGAVVANLWNVTDGEIDRFLSSLLDKMEKNGGKNGQMVLEKAVMECRNSCYLKYLTGASPVVYGFPTLVHKLI